MGSFGVRSPWDALALTPFFISSTENYKILSTVHVTSSANHTLLEYIAIPQDEEQVTK